MSETTPINSACPCGSGATLDACCGPAIQNRQPAPTAEALMRSRYSAYVLEHSEHLLRSWNPETRPSRVRFSPDQQWLGLRIVATDKGGMLDQTGVVEFIARYRDGSGQSSIHERSRFVRTDGAWTYVDGIHDPK